MLKIRCIENHDLAGLLTLITTSASGLTSLPIDEKTLAAKIETAVNSFQKTIIKPDHALYLFVMEDLQTQTIVGCCGVQAAIGVNNPTYAYRINCLDYHCDSLAIHHQLHTLTVSSDLKGCSEICSLYVLPTYRQQQHGTCLSLARFLFMAQYPDLFAPTVIAEMRGFTTTDGISPFWENLGRHFFNMDFHKADHLSEISDKDFINCLLPREPIIIELLPQDAQDCIGKTHCNTVKARQILETQGFRFNQHVDIFDAGPILSAPMKNISAIQNSQIMTIAKIQPGITGDVYLICTTAGEFSAIKCALQLIDKQHVIIDTTIATLLNLQINDQIRLLLLR